MAYTFVAADLAGIHRKAFMIARLTGLHFICGVTDGVKQGVFVSTPWTDSKFLVVFVDGSYVVNTPAESLNILGQLAATIP